MNSRVSLSISCRDAFLARALHEVLAPDNVGIPKGERLEMKTSGSVLKADVEGDDLLSVLSTATAILSDASLFQEVSLLIGFRKMKRGAN